MAATRARFHSNRNTSRLGIGQPVDPQSGETCLSAERCQIAERRFSGQNICPKRRILAGKLQPRHALSRGIAVVHARYDFLADIAAFVEIDAMQQIHIGIMDECVAIGKIDAALGDSECDSVILVSCGTVFTGEDG